MNTSLHVGQVLLHTSSHRSVGIASPWEHARNKSTKVLPPRAPPPPPNRLARRRHSITTRAIPVVSKEKPIVNFLASATPLYQACDKKPSTLPPCAARLWRAAFQRRTPHRQDRAAALPSEPSTPLLRPRAPEEPDDAAAISHEIVQATALPLLLHSPPPQGADQSLALHHPVKVQPEKHRHPGLRELVVLSGRQPCRQRLDKVQELAVVPLEAGRK